MSKLYNSADGFTVLFECPGCECCHQVWVKPSPGKPCWEWNQSMTTPTFSPSILVQYDRWEPPVTSENLEQWQQKPWEQKKVPFVCHSFVREGKIQFLTDCTHKLAGQTVELPEVH